MIDIQLADLNVTRDIKDESEASLANRVCQVFPNNSSWIMDLCVKNGPVSEFSPQDCWAELIARRNKKMTSNIKTVVVGSYTGRVLSIDVDKVTSKGKSGPDLEIKEVAGFLVPASMAEKEKTKADAALEVALETMLMAQVTDPSDKKAYASYIDTAKAALVKFPVHNLSLALKGKSYKAPEIDKFFRSKEKTHPGSTVQYATTFFPKTVPGVQYKPPQGDVDPSKQTLANNAIVWNTYKFNFGSIAIPNFRKINQDLLHRVIRDYRDLRGKDQGRRSMYTKGYYFGYCDNTIYRAFNIVADLERLARATIGARFLRIDKVDKIFTDAVIASLIINGWVIEIRNAMGLKEYDMSLCYDTVKSQPTNYDTEKAENKNKKKYNKNSISKAKYVKVSNPKKAKIIPGAYRKIKECRYPFLVHYDLAETTVVLKKDPSGTHETADLHSVVRRLEDVQSECNANGTVPFSYLYYRDEFNEEMHDYFYPTVHAHSGFLLFCGKKNRQPLDMHKYLLRVIHANAYKNFFVYNRELYRHKDPYAVDFPVRLSVPKIKKELTTSVWTDEDFEVDLLVDEYVPIPPIDYQALAEELPLVSYALNNARDAPNSDENQQLIDDLADEMDAVISAQASAERTLAGKNVEVEENYYESAYDN